MEIWKNIRGFEGLYQISTHGNVKSVRKNLILIPVVNAGYFRINLYRKGKRFPTHVHKIVGEEFIKNPKHLKMLNHKDGNKLNNNLNNLEWCTPSENVQHAFNMGLCKSGEKHYNSKLSDNDIRFIRTSGISNVKLSKMLKVSEHQIFQIKNRRCWKHVI